MSRKKKEAHQAGQAETEPEVWVLKSKPASPAQKAVRRGLMRAIKAYQESQKYISSWGPWDRPIGSSLRSMRIAA